MAAITQAQRKILNISLPQRLYAEIEKWARRQAKTKAEFTRDVLRQYFRSEKEWVDIFRLGKKTAKRFGIKNEDDIERIVDEIRCSK